MEQEQILPNFDAGIAQDQAREKDAPENRARPWNGRITSLMDESGGERGATGGLNGEKNAGQPEGKRLPGHATGR
ncbi:MAG: hypothetical protein NTAFB09_10210 [Nitrosospira sp.]